MTTDLIPLTPPASDRDLASAVRRFLTDAARPEPDPITALELALARRDLDKMVAENTAQHAEAVGWRYAYLEAEARAEAAELEAYQQGCGASNLAIEVGALKDEAQRRELHIIELAGQLETRGAKLAAARARIAEVEEQLTRRLEEIDQLGRRLAEALDERQSANGPKTPAVRVLMAGGAPRTLDPCPHCGREFDDNRGRVAHVRLCPKNPDRQHPKGRPPRPLAALATPAKASPERRAANEVTFEAPYVCPLCGEAAFAKAPTADLCIRCARGAKAA